MRAAQVVPREFRGVTLTLGALPIELRPQVEGTVGLEPTTTRFDGEESVTIASRGKYVIVNQVYEESDPNTGSVTSGSSSLPLRPTAARFPQRFLTVDRSGLEPDIVLKHSLRPPRDLTQLLPLGRMLQHRPGALYL